MESGPRAIEVRMWNVGFGDCFLLTFRYRPPLADQHVLIDFGTAGGGRVDMQKTAAAIRDACGGKLYAVVATHRHRDHVSGFSAAGGEESPGAIIASCRPEVVLQPWTEDPDAAADATSAPLLAKRRRGSDRRLFFASLHAMSGLAASIAEAEERRRGGKGRALPLERLAANNVANAEASKNLARMGRRRPRYLHYGAPSGLESKKLLPGVRVRVLGPPTLGQQNLRKYAKASADYWLACKFWGLTERAAREAGSADLFPGEPRHGERSRPLYARWFARRADAALRRSELAVVRVLDEFLNNTSLILLFEANGKKLLFPGDAQLEDWSWALSQPGVKELLAGVDLYKVGHHGSRNATPRELWDGFAKLRSKRAGAVLQTMMSTSAGVYGRSEEGKVPSERLVAALKSESDLSSTQDLHGARGPIVVEL